MPFPLAQAAAVSYQAPAAASGKGASTENAGAPSSRHSTVTTVARVTAALGLNAVSLVPVIYPARDTASTASAYQASAATSL